ncbi:hypothetical protein [Bradyrhizobium sp.]|uniref:hypothetical protein n=1 Tax=Bradyrhizobium sp. TaxID=376 RepID=UPI001EC32F4F|nr:hypothetical protein [Bradyrhizobium sp.]MBV9479954.1 hypothetical protein [Acidobacteriota bacterium]MBV9979886.1 hypothetical protein [Bradyrhizobium sp.]
MKATSLLLFSAFASILFCGRFSTASLAEENRVVDELIWGQAKSTGRMVALSRDDEAFNFFDIGNLSQSSQPLVHEALNKLSSASGVRIERGPDKSWSIGIFHDANVFARLKNDKQAFRVVGVPDELIGALEQRLADDTKCITMTRSDSEENVLLTVILSSQQTNFDECLVSGLLYSFGIAANEINTKTLLGACILHEARRAGLRDREYLSAETSKFNEKCLAKLESPK